MDRSVLDTSVIIKSIFKPPRTLSSKNYKRGKGFIVGDCM